MADFHAADLWVAVTPDISAVAGKMEDAGKIAKDKFGEGSKGIGKSIDDELDQVSRQAKDKFERAGSEAGTSFRSTIGESFKDAVGDITSAFRSGDITGAIDGVKSKVGGISDVAKQVGIDLSGWAPNLDKSKAPLDEVDTKMKSALDGVTQMSSMFEGMPGKIGKVAGKLGEVGVIAAAVISELDDIKSADNWLESKIPWYKDVDEAYKNGPLKWFKGLFKDDPAPSAPNVLSGGNEPIPYPQNFIGPIPYGGTRAPGGQAPPTPGPAGPPNLYKDWYGTPDSSGGGGSGSRGGGGGGRSGGSGSSYTKPSIGSPTDRSSLAAAGSRVANLYAFASSLVGTPYSQDLRDDCSGLVSELAAVAVGLPPPPASARFSTPTEGDWLLSHGFKMGMGGPGDLRIGWNPAPGNAGHTAATLPGGEHAEQGGSHGSFLIGPGAAGADSPQFSQHAYLPMGGGKGGGGGQAPTGAEHDPIYTTATGPGGSSTSPHEQQGNELGQGIVNGLLQAVGLDGSVFGGKSPLDWGAVKLGMGALNWGLGQAKAAGGGPMGGGGGGGGIAGALSGLIPSPNGTAISAGATPTASSASGSIGIGAATNVQHDHSITANFHGPADNTQSGIMTALQFMKNQDQSRANAYSTSLPATS